VSRRAAGRRLLVPAIVQTSPMDCGPATLKCLLSGFGVEAGYERLREACQTDVDGTSIDNLEEIANELGLDALQVMVPVDHVLLSATDVLPAVAVMRLPSGLFHFVVVWRRHGRWVQVMDPGYGRRWMKVSAFNAQLLRHATMVPAEAWRAHAGSPAFVDPLRQRLRELGLGDAADRSLRESLADPSWRSIAALDAACRMAASLVAGGGLRRRDPARRFIAGLWKLERGGELHGAIPARYYAVSECSGDPSQLRFTAAVLVRVHGLRHRNAGERAAARVRQVLAAALAERAVHPARRLAQLVRSETGLGPVVFAAVSLIALAIGMAGEGLLLRALLDMGDYLGPELHRLVGLGVVVLFVMGLTLLELPVFGGARRLGRHLEVRLRTAIFHRVPRIGDRYFASRTTSDMANRAHAVHELRRAPLLATELVRVVLQIGTLTAGLIVLARPVWPFVLFTSAVTVASSALAQWSLAERDLRVRTYSGALGQFFLDSLLGLTAVRTHRAERALRREHESMLSRWVQASYALLRARCASEALLGIFTLAATALLLFTGARSTGEGTLRVLFVYWTLSLVVLGRELGSLYREYPSLRNVAARILEPLGGEQATSSSWVPSRTGVGLAPGVELELRDVSVRASGHTILDDVNLRIGAGEHVAIVGASGAGKSSLVGLVLGWHRPATGELLVDGRPLDDPLLATVRADTAWIDPAAYLWNRSILDNLLYGNEDGDTSALTSALAAADLGNLLESLPEGLDSRLGEGGALVSGGEGQRVRLGRAMLRTKARLVVLDEAFRGLDRNQRGTLLTAARNRWSKATLLCVTHDVSETLAFPRVLVVEGGRIVEDGAPADLERCATSQFARLLRSERRVHADLFGSARWRHCALTAGRITETREAK